MELHPLTSGSLKPFPLPKQVSSLPQSTLNQFVELYELVKGYVKTLPGYENQVKGIRQEIDGQVSKLNEIIVMLQEYRHTSEEIQQLIQKITEMYREFQNLETIQYQLLSTNYNQEFLKAKYSKLVEADNERSLQLVREFKQSKEELPLFLELFKQSRKQYHNHREKLNRWNEERVTGFI